MLLRNRDHPRKRFPKQIPPEKAPGADRRDRRGLRAFQNAVFRAVGRLYTAAAARRDVGRRFRQRDGAALHVPR